MGTDSEVILYVAKEHPTAIMNKEELERKKIQMTPVVIIDFTYSTKFIGDFPNGEEYMKKQVIGDFDRYFKNGCEIMFLVYDRFSPCNKGIEHKKRYGKIVPTPTPSTIEDVMEILAPRRTDDLSTFVATNPRVRYAGHTLDRTTYASDATMDSINEFESSLITSYKQALIRMDENEREGDGEETPDRVSLLVMSDLVSPRPDMWSRVVCNPQLKKEIMHYITCKLVCDPNNPFTYQSGVFKRGYIPIKAAEENPTVCGFTPKNGKFLCVHGGQSNKPTRGEDAAKPRYSDDFLTVVRVDEETNTRVVESADNHHPRSVVGNLGEGEIACMYYALSHKQRDVMLVSGDGDTLLISLLASKYRLTDEKTLTFPAALYDHLRLPGSSKKRAKKANKNVTEPLKDELKRKYIGQNKYFDVNDLYVSLHKRGHFRKCVDPVATFVAIMLLMKNDFIQDFASGLSSGCSTSRIPWLVMPFACDPDKYANMITIDINPTMTSPPGSRGEANFSRSNEATINNIQDHFFRESTDDDHQNEEELIYPLKTTPYDAYIKEARSQFGDKLREVACLPEINIDYYLFEEYVEECYVHKYGSIKKVQEGARKRAREYGDANEREMREFLSSAVAEHTRSFKDPRKHLPSSRQIEAYGRRLEWVLTYWTQGYILDCKFPNPVETYQGKSYYGWKREEEAPFSCVPTDDISPMKPSRILKKQHTEGNTKGNRPTANTRAQKKAVEKKRDPKSEQFWKDVFDSDSMDSPSGSLDEDGFPPVKRVKRHHSTTSSVTIDLSASN